MRACESLLADANVDGCETGVLSILAIIRDVSASAEAAPSQDNVCKAIKGAHLLQLLISVVPLDVTGPHDPAEREGQTGVL